MAAAWGLALAFGAAAITTLALAWSRGGAERRGALLFLFGWLADLAALQAPERLARAGSLLLVDLVILIALGRLAWKSERDWPAWGAGFLAVRVALDVAYGGQPGLPAFIQTVAASLAGAGALAALLGSLARAAPRWP